MIETMWWKHWMELRGSVFLTTAVGILPCVLFVFQASIHPAAPRASLEGLFGPVAVLLTAFSPARLAGTGVRTAEGTRPQRTTDPSLLFTLSLPVRRRTLLFYRASSGLLALEAGTVLALLINALVFGSLVSAIAPWRAFTYGLWIMLAMVPVYFLDGFLSIWFTEAAVLQIQAFCIAGAVVLLGLADRLPGVFITLFHHLTPRAVLPTVLGAILVSAGLAALTVRRLDGHDF
jgi:hypothetical protein